jgi:hypothetical protein
MVEPQGVLGVLKKLSLRGYTKDFKSAPNTLILNPDGIEIIPEELVVDAIYRFEGQTDLDDEEIIFALSYPKLDIKGTYLVAFGPMMDPQDSAMVLRLKKLKH